MNLTYKAPYVVFDDLTGDKRAYRDPADAITTIFELNHACEVLDGNGTHVSLKQLIKAMDEYNQNLPEKEEKEMNKYAVDIHTDGACSGNPGPGGYAGIIVFKDKEKTIRGYQLTATNNAMELKAVVESVKALNMPCNITIHTDSQYLCSCSKHDKAWFEKSDRPNKDLWFELIQTGIAGKHSIKFVKVQGHSGEVYNERCDKIAKEQVKKACHILAEELRGNPNGRI